MVTWPKARFPATADKKEMTVSNRTLGVEKANGINLKVILLPKREIQVLFNAFLTMI
jgi:hypothetical protein